VARAGVRAALLAGLRHCSVRKKGCPTKRKVKLSFFLFKKVLNQILHHIYKPKFDLLTCGYFKIYFLYHFWKQGIFS